jgi:hypothetical protein
VVTTGKLGDDGVITFVGESSNCMTGEKDCWGRSTMDLQDATKHVYSSFGKGDSDEEFKNMELVETKAR